LTPFSFFSTAVLAEPPITQVEEVVSLMHESRFERLRLTQTAMSKELMVLRPSLFALCQLSP